jgi:hypothetical protein
MEDTLMIRFATGLMVSSLAFAGCMDQGDSPEDTTADEPATSSTAQSVSWTALQWHSCTSLSCGWSLGDPATSTCFIAGVTGRLADGSTSYPAQVAVINNGTYWGLSIANPSYNNISVMTTCIPNTGHRSEASWYAGAAAKLIPAGAGVNRKCFLAGITNWSPKAFSTWESNVTISRDPDNVDYWIGGDFPAGSNMRVDARCVDIPYNYGDWNIWWGYPTNYTGTLAFNPASSGVACALTGIGGPFTTSDATKGVVINYDASTRYWNWSFTPGIHGYSECFK